jgi:hypothetical protein
VSLVASGVASHTCGSLRSCLWSLSEGTLKGPNCAQLTWRIHSLSYSISKEEEAAKLRNSSRDRSPSTGKEGLISCINSNTSWLKQRTNKVWLSGMPQDRVLTLTAKETLRLTTSSDSWLPLISPISTSNCVRRRPACHAKDVRMR